MDLSLTKKEFNTIGQKPFITWFRNNANYLAALNNWKLNDIITATYHKHLGPVTVVKYMTSNSVLGDVICGFVLFDSGINAKWEHVSHDPFFKYNQKLTDSFNNFITCEKNKLIIKSHNK